MVEGGTLLRCYTSQRGIEGSNPSSSARNYLFIENRKGISWKKPPPLRYWCTNAAWNRLLQISTLLVLHIFFLNVSRSFWEPVGSAENSWPVNGVFKNSL